jgi:hypothetical protein
MMNHFAATCLFASLTATAPAVAATLPPQTASYSAVAAYDIGGNHYTSTIEADHGRERRVVKTDFGPQTVLIDPAAGKAYLLQPPVGAFALDLGSKAVGIDLAQLYRAQATPLGRETIDGLPVTRYRLSASAAANAQFAGDVWSTDDGIFVRIEGEGTYRGKSSHVAIRLTDIVHRREDPAAFSLPTGTRVIDASPIVQQLLDHGTH